VTAAKSVYVKTLFTTITKQITSTKKTKISYVYNA
jgi:hypothetical protein